MKKIFAILMVVMVMFLVGTKDFSPVHAAEVPATPAIAGQGNPAPTVPAIAAQAAADNSTVSAVAGTANTTESPSAFASFARSVKSSRLNEKLKVDGFLFVGKLYDVQKDEVGDYERMNLTSKKGSYFVQSEVGVRYGIVRPFVGYEALTHVYDKKTVGTDVFFYSTEAAGSFGIRTGYAATKRTGVDTQSYLFTGLLWKF